MQEKVHIGFKVNAIDEIAIRQHAKTYDMSVSAFCRMAIQQYIKQEIPVQNQKQQNAENEKILFVLNAIHNLLNDLKENHTNHYQHMMGGFRRVAQSFIVTNPQSVQDLQKIFTDKQIWSLPK